MSNSFSKEERVAFEQLLEGFNDSLVISKAVKKYRTDPTQMVRSNQRIWRPIPYIAQSYSGLNQTSNFSDYTQLSVPATIGAPRSVPWTMDAIELNDALQEGRLGDAARQKLASDINLAVWNQAAVYGSIVATHTTAASSYNDIALVDAMLSEQGIPMEGRHLFLNPSDYNGLANDLSKASRSFGNAKSESAYERNLVGDVAGFMTHKSDVFTRLTAALGAGDEINTTVAGAQFYVPEAMSVALTGEESLVDNRFQTVTVTNTTNVKAGDCFTIEGVYAVHHITKENTGRLKTFRVVSVDSGTTMTITPPLITGQGGTDAELQYQNCEVDGSGLAAADITYINFDSAAVNVFFHESAIELLPGTLEIPTNAGAAVLRGTLDNGIPVVMSKQYDIRLGATLFRVDTIFGTVNLAPEQSGILLFGQTP